MDLDGYDLGPAGSGGNSAARVRAVLADLGCSPAEVMALARDGAVRLNGTIDLNLATVEELDTLPGVQRERSTEREDSASGDQ